MWKVKATYFIFDPVQPNRMDFIEWSHYTYGTNLGSIVTAPRLRLQHFVAGHVEPERWREWRENLLGHLGHSAARTRTRRIFTRCRPSREFATQAKDQKHGKAKRADWGTSQVSFWSFKKDLLLVLLNHFSKLQGGEAIQKYRKKACFNFHQNQTMYFGGSIFRVLTPPIVCYF